MNATAAQVREFAAALPAVEEREHMGVKMPFDEQAARVNAEPDRYSLPEHWARFGWTYVRLAGTDPGELRELLERSWQAIAPKKRGRAHELRGSSPSR